MKEKLESIVSELNKNPEIRGGWKFTEEWTWNQFTNKNKCITFSLENNQVYAQVCSSDGQEVYEGFKFLKEEVNSLNNFMNKLEPYFIKYN